MNITPTSLPGSFVLQPHVFEDHRGRFVKVFHERTFAEHNLVTDFAEDYYSVSHASVLRGMHFQKPPTDHAKVVYCTEGRILDAIVDLRRGSPSYGGHFTVELTAEDANMLYIPRGMAHGFFVLSGPATVGYKVETVHNPRDDAGIAWDGCGVKWPTATPLLSARDEAFPTLADFISPFEYRGEGVSA